VRRAAVAQTPQASESTAAAAAVGKRRVVRKRRRRAHVVDPAITREGSLLGPLLLGLLLLAAIAWFAIKHYTPHIQRDLLRRSTEALQNEGLPNSAFVEIDGRNATLKGSVANRADRDRAEAAVAGTFGVRHVDNQLSLAGTGQQQATSRQPSTFSVARDGEKTTIQGTVSAQHYADSLTDAAEQAFGADNIDSNIAIEAGTTNPGWLPALPGLLSDVAQLPDGSLDITGDAITLSGTTETNEQRDALLAKADAAVGNLLTVNDELTSLQPESATAPVSEASDSETTEDTTAQDTETAAQPAAEETPPVETPAPQMSLGLSNRGDSIELRGAMGDEQTKAALLEQAQLIYGEDAVTDAITIDPAITDPQWAQSIGSSFADIKSLKHGNLSIGNGAAFLTGTTNSPSTKTAIEEKLAATFAGDTDFESNVMAIPDRPASLLIKNTDSEIALSGNLPPQSAADLLTAVEGGTDLPLIDLINIDDRVITPDWVDPLTQSLSQLDSIEQPSVEIDAEGTLIVGGQADTAEARETAAASVAELFPESVSLRNDINVKTPTIVEPEPVDINTLLAGIDLSGIRFGSNSAELTPESLAILDSVADALSQVPGTSLEIGGHTDSLGDYNYNLSLSASRAEAVRSQLASRGIADERMIARGYGPDSPIATNETRAGRASNRRIEFKIITGD
jgi:OOP family OmpA-OmpF porin